MTTETRDYSKVKSKSVLLKMWLFIQQHLLVEGFLFRNMFVGEPRYSTKAAAFSHTTSQDPA